MKKTFLIGLEFIPTLGLPNLRCYEKIFTLANNSIFHYFITRNRPVNRQTKNFIWY